MKIMRIKFQLRSTATRYKFSKYYFFNLHSISFKLYEDIGRRGIILDIDFLVTCQSIRRLYFSHYGL